MPRKCRRQRHSRIAVLRRHHSQGQHFSDEEEYCSTIPMEIEMEDQEDDGNGDEMEFKMKVDGPNISDMFELCKRECESRKLSVLIYMILRYLGHNWRQIDDILHQIGVNQCKIAHKWALTFLDGGFGVFDDDGRGGKHNDGFYDQFPELEIQAKAFAVEACSKKSASFTTVDLAKYLDEQFYEITQTSKVNASLVRSAESCRLDLRRWGAKFQSNSQRPYFEGHERDDVVKHRQEFISYFLERKDRYYTISEDEQPQWNLPTGKPCVLIFHDESTFKSGEVSAKRWTVDGHTPFFSKGRGRSHMISDYLVQHPSGPFFSLSEKEYEQATRAYPNLLSDSDDLNFNRFSATAGINVGEQGYFDNVTILCQFERLFQLLPFKKEYKDHDIEVVVDNAITHSAKEYNINEFGKGIGTNCP
ncbi:unnamed protein product, partial [Rotaria sp. Silwood2]